MNPRNSVKGLIEVQFNDRENFLKIMETLTRIGIPDYKNKVLKQECHILSKQGKYYIVHYKEMLKLDGLTDEISVEDTNRRNSIVQLLDEWNLCNPKDKEKFAGDLPRSKMKVLSHKMKNQWTLKSNYNIGQF